MHYAYANHNVMVLDPYCLQNLTTQNNSIVIDKINIENEVKLENQNILFEVGQDYQNYVLLPASDSKRDDVTN